MWEWVKKTLHARWCVFIIAQRCFFVNKKGKFNSIKNFRLPLQLDLLARVGGIVDGLHHAGGDDDLIDVGGKLLTGADATDEAVDLILEHIDGTKMILMTEFGDNPFPVFSLPLWDKSTIYFCKTLAVRSSIS